MQDATNAMTTIPGTQGAIQTATLPRRCAKVAANKAQ